MEVLRIESVGADEAEHALKPFFPGLSLGADHDRTLAFGVEVHTGGDLTILEYHLSGPAVRAQTDPVEFGICQVALDGRLENERDIVDTRKPFTTFGRFRMASTRSDARSLQIDPDAIRRYAASELGNDAFVLDARQHGAVTTADAAAWTRTSDFVWETCRALAADDRLIGAALSELIMATYLRVFPSNWAAARRLQDGTHATTATVRRAKAFIDENYAKPITSVEIAQAARMSIRGIQSAFQRSEGISPMTYLRRVRLNAARRALLTADPTQGVTVASVALAAGFAHAPRFAAAYNAMFGELPSRTLRR